MKTGPGEPQAGPWRTVTIDALTRLVFDPHEKPQDRPWTLAIDGRSGGGKTTVSNLLHQAVAASAIVHTDDVAWHHSFFDWGDLIIENILKPLHAGHAVSYQPPGWAPNGRTGSIEVPADLDLVIVEGVGAAQPNLMPWIDRVVWVQSDFDEAERRGIERDGGTQEHIDFWHEWMAAELVFLGQHRPWERAAVIINGTPTQPHDRDSEVIIAPTLA